jgi:hypothetical protein
MTDPITFPSSTPALSLPLLIAGQAQKEFYVNQALSLLDALYARVVTASQATPPASAPDGACYRVTGPATGAWTGHNDQVAVRAGGDWHFVAPVEGLVLFDRAVGHMLVFRSQWRLSSAPAVPGGGTVIDTEARVAIGAIIDALRTLGILGTPSA